MSHLHSIAFDEASIHVRDTFKRRLPPGAPLFTTAIHPNYLWALYLDYMPGGMVDAQTTIRQFHNCNCCRRFIQRFGGLVTIDPTTGEKRSALWNGTFAGVAYARAFRAMDAAVSAEEVTGVFSTDALRLGVEHEGGHNHFFVETPSQCVQREPVPYSALKLQDFGTLRTALALPAFAPAALDRAIALLKTGIFHRPEKILPGAEFLASCHGLGTDQLWVKVAQAPNGWCTPRTNVVGQILEGLHDGDNTATLAGKINAMMGGLAYQRPTAAPKAGTIVQAEKLFAELGLERSLKRRFATIDDVELLWRARIAPPAPKPAARTTGAFSHLQPRDRAAPAPQLTEIPGCTPITFEKFRREVMPGARSMHLLLGSGGHNFGAFTTAVDPAAPLLFQWDNPVAQYIYHGGSPRSRWGLSSSGPLQVEGITLLSHLWGGGPPLSHHGKAALLILKGAYDTHNRSLALFPETIRGDLHGVRSVIEAHSKSGRLAVPAGKQIAAGLITSSAPTTVVVTTDQVKQNYKIDRWD